MTAIDASTSRLSLEADAVVRVVTVIVGVVVGLTFLFGFGNVLNLALRLGVPGWVAPLVAPAVDLSVIGLFLGTRHLALAGASAAALRPARRLLIFASMVTLALNVADPLVAGDFGKAAFDAVGPHPAHRLGGSRTWLLAGDRRIWCGSLCRWCGWCRAVEGT